MNAVGGGSGQGLDRVEEERIGRGGEEGRRRIEKGVWGGWMGARRSE